MKVQNEIQSMHWHTFQVSILIHITYQLDPSYIGSGPKDLLKDVHYYVFNDISHDQLFVQHCFMLHWNFLEVKGCHPK